MDSHNLDAYDPDRYPPMHESIMGDWMRQDGYMDQWRLLAQHVAEGGEVTSSPYPPLERYNPGFIRDATIGIQSARTDARELVRQDLYDAHEILDTFREEDEVERQQRQLRADVFGGEFAWPTEDARLHTTVSRLFTDDVVHDVCGYPHETQHLDSASISLPGPVTLLGLRDIEIGVQGDGQLRLDAVDADSRGPGSGTLAVRVVWGDPATIVGAAEAGEIRGHNRWIGVGSPGGSQLMVDDAHLVIHQEGGRFRRVESPKYGTSVWVWTHGGDPWRIFVAVDVQRRPVGLIFDTSYVSNYYWAELDPDDDEDDSIIDVTSEWPEGAKEFDPMVDAPGLNPNRPADEQVKGFLS